MIEDEEFFVLERGFVTAIDGQSGDTLAITVILCTYNRCHGLTGTLESISASQLPSSVTWEVLIVDNNSNDQTREVVEGFCRRYPGRFRYLFEPKAGKSNALNSAIANARGEVLAFTDDDVNVAPTWLHSLTATLLQDDQWAGSGGRTLPAQRFIPPRWLSNDLSLWCGILCAYFDLGDNPCKLERPPYGANMALRKRIFAKYGGYRTDLGPSPNPDIPRPGEDAELGSRLIAAGERLRYEPSAIVYHPIPQGRMTQEYFLTWWFDYRRTQIRLRGDRPNVWIIPYDYFSFVRCALGMPALTVLWMFSINPQKRFWRKCRVWQAAGQLFELRRRNRSRKEGNSRDAGEKIKIAI
jgi:glycosyltransferase involved in cell wall biosynthesis